VGCKKPPVKAVLKKWAVVGIGGGGAELVGGC